MRLLIVRLSAMGDVIHALPLARNARAFGATVAWVVERPFAPVLDGNPSCDRILMADTKAWRRRPFSAATLKEVSAFRDALRAFAPDRTVDVQGLWKSAVIARDAGATVAGFSAAERREPASALLCPVRVTPRETAFHIVERNLALLSAVGIPVTERAPDARYLLARPSAEADRFLAEVPRPFVVLHPGAGRPGKAWGEERFARLAQALEQEHGLHPVISWGPGDTLRRQAMHGLLPTASIPPLLDVSGLAHVLHSATLLVAGDTGPLHLADALGVRTLGLFGPTDPARNGPYRNRGGVVTSMRDISDAAVLARAAALLGPL